MEAGEIARDNGAVVLEAAGERGEEEELVVVQLADTTVGQLSFQGRLGRDGHVGGSIEARQL